MADQYDMSGVHSANLKILKEVDRICRMYKIRYGLDAGTLIGAVRHHGFIPWDDDADVYFTRSQYEAFCKVAPRELPEGMELLEPDKLRGGKAFYDFTPRIIYHNSRRHGDTPEMAYYEGRLNHLWVDLFIIDKLPAGKFAAAMTRFLHKAVYGLAMGHRYHLDFKKYSLPHKIFVGGGTADPNEGNLRHAAGRGLKGPAQQGKSALLQQLPAGFPVRDRGEELVRPGGGYGLRGHPAYGPGGLA